MVKHQNVAALRPQDTVIGSVSATNLLYLDATSKPECSCNLFITQSLVDCLTTDHSGKGQHIVHFS